MLFRLARLPSMVMGKRFAHTSVSANPKNYSIPLRPVTMDDMMEPYGSWKIAYAAEKKNANITLVKGILSLTATLMLFYYSGVADGIFMPNLDNIMEETEPCNFDKEGRKTV